MDILTISAVKPGRKVLITGGIHGDELTSYSLLYRLKDQIPTAGRFRIIPFVNREGLIARSHMYPDSNLELNRSFQREDIPLLSEVKREIELADCVIDIHSHQYTKTITYGVVFRGKGLELESTELLSRAGVKYLEYADVADNFERIGGTLSYYAITHGKPTVVIETSNLDLISESGLSQLSSSLLNLGDVAARPDFHLELLRTFKLEQDMIVDTVYKELGEVVAYGEKIFAGWTIVGNSRITINSEYSGKLITLPRKTYLTSGHTAYRLTQD